MTLRKKDINDVIILFENNDGIELLYANSYKKPCYLILASLTMDYEE